VARDPDGAKAARQASAAEAARGGGRVTRPRANSPQGHRRRARHDSRRSLTTSVPASLDEGVPGRWPTAVRTRRSSRAGQSLLARCFGPAVRVPPEAAGGTLGRAPRRAAGRGLTLGDRAADRGQDDATTKLIHEPARGPSTAGCLRRAASTVRPIPPSGTVGTLGGVLGGHADPTPAGDLAPRWRWRSIATLIARGPGGETRDPRGGLLRGTT